MKTITKVHAAEATDSKHPLKHVPKNIFQTYSSTELTEGAYNAVNSWRKLNPEWTHYFFTDEDQRAFIAEHFSEDVLWAYDQLIPGAYKADLWRYCVLYIKGGVYADHKLILEKPLDDMLPEDLHFATYQDRPQKHRTHWHYSHYIWQAFLISEPGHPFLKQAIDMIVTNVQNGFYGHDTLCITGPGLLGNAINICLQRDADTPLTPDHYQMHGLTFDILPSPILKNGFDATMFGHEQAMSQYKQYRHDRSVKNYASKHIGVTDYAAAWFLGEVFKHGKCDRQQNDLYYRLKLRGFYRRKIISAYKHQQYDFARQLMQKSLQFKPFQPKIWWLWLKYELFKKQS